MWDSLTEGACLELLRLFDPGCASSHHQSRDDDRAFRFNAQYLLAHTG
jgi:hypothetical protein